VLPGGRDSLQDEISPSRLILKSDNGPAKCA